MLRFGQLSADEYFVSEAASRAGITIRNDSRWEPMVILKHFGPNHPDMPQAVVNSVFRGSIRKCSRRGTRAQSLAGYVRSSRRRHRGAARSPASVGLGS